MKAKLTVASKKRITQEWIQEFPSLGIYKPMWLMRIVGVLVQGICLDLDSGNDNYLPTFHLHNLAHQKGNFISLTFLLQGYTEEEIGVIEGVSRQSIHHHQTRIRQIAMEVLSGTSAQCVD